MTEIKFWQVTSAILRQLSGERPVRQLERVMGCHPLIEIKVRSGALADTLLKPTESGGGSDDSPAGFDLQRPA